MLKKIFFLFLLLIFFSSTVCAEDSDKVSLLNAVSQQLSVEQAHNQLLLAKLKVLRSQTKSSAKVPQIQPDALKRADVAISLAQTDLESTTLTLSTAEQAIELTQNNIVSLQEQLGGGQVRNFPGLTTTQDNQLEIQLKELRALLTLQQQRVKSLEKTQTLATQILSATEDWKSHLQATYQMQQQMQRQNTLNQLVASLQREQQAWLTRLAKLNQQLQKSDIQGLFNNSSYVRLEMDIFQAEEKSDLSQLQLELARLRNHLEDLALTPGQTISISVLNTEEHQIKTLEQQLKQMKEVLETKIKLLQKRIAITKQGMETGMISFDEGQKNLQMMNDLQAEYQDQLTVTENLLQIAYASESAVVTKLNQQLANRQGLPGFNAEGWLMLGGKILEVPMLTWQLIQGWYKPVALAISSTPTWQFGLGFVALIFWGVLWINARRYLKVAIDKLMQQRERHSANPVLLISLPLLQRHLNFLMLFGVFIGLILFLEIPLATFNFLISLIFVVLIFSLLNGFARVLLLENTENKGGHDVVFYHRLKWALWIGGLFTGLSVLVHQLPIAYDVQDLFGRLFMLFLLLVSLVLLRGWFGLPTLFGITFENSRPYVQKIVRWLSLLVPLTLLSNALIGLVGYVELAWSIAAYQGIFLVVMTGYLFASGLLGELMRFVALQFIQNLRNGWLWTEAILKPIHFILKILLLLAAFFVLFALYGWDSHSWVVIKLNQLLNLRLFILAGSAITLSSLIKLSIIIAALVWATRWTREFAYRWIFFGVKDLGLRNSFSIFSRYLMITFGILIGLHVVGINLTALTFIASAFAFGVGLGLRDLANNFVSGILLLIERPVRVGDYITVGNNEGEVTHIGMRSITVMTDDRQELLVPNANIFSQAFINWTHRDSIVRTVVPIKINRVDDPHHVREIILQILKSIPEVLSKPPPVIYLKRMDEALLEFQVQFYTDLKLHSKDGIRSKVLLAVWDQFKVEGIHPPEAAHEIFVKGSLVGEI